MAPRPHSITGISDAYNKYSFSGLSYVRMTAYYNMTKEVAEEKIDQNIFPCTRISPSGRVYYENRYSYQDSDKTIKQYCSSDYFSSGQICLVPPIEPPKTKDLEVTVKWLTQVGDATSIEQNCKDYTTNITTFNSGQTNSVENTNCGFIKTGLIESDATQTKIISTGFSELTKEVSETESKKNHNFYKY